MSLITEQVKQLREYASNKRGEIADICKNAADTIEMLSEKAKFNDWIPVSDRLPENRTYVLTSIHVPDKEPHARSGWYDDNLFMNDNGDTWKSADKEVKAWMPLPEPYKEVEQE